MKVFFLLSMLLLKIPTLEPSPTWSELLTTHVPSWTCRCRSTMDLQLFIYTLLPPRRSALHPNHDANTIVQIPGGTAPRGTKSCRVQPSKAAYKLPKTDSGGPSSDRRDRGGYALDRRARACRAARRPPACASAIRYDYS